MFRFFEEETFVKIFRNGEIRLMSNEYYATGSFDPIAQKSGELYNNKFDSTEGHSYVVNRENDKIEETKEYKISEGFSMTLSPEVKRVVLRSPNLNSKTKIMSFTLLNDEEIPDKKFGTVIDSMKDDLGKYYVCFTNPAEFIRRVKNKLDEMMKEGTVKRYKFAEPNYMITRPFEGATGPFDKPDGLAWQREVRLYVETTQEKDPFWVKIGSIKDITCWGKTEDMKNGYIKDDDTIVLPNHQV